MALFKMLQGDESNISLDVTPFHEGWVYITNTGYFYVDLNIGTAESPNNQRIKLNAANAETLMGKSLAELQADWSVNDETNPAYVKNRTHWIDTEHVTFIDNETIEFASFDGLFTTDMIENDVVFVDDHTYTFTIDGASYDCVAHLLADYGFTYIGNLSFFDPDFEDTLEPFCALCYNNAEVSTMLLASAGIQFATTLEGNSHVISLSGLVDTYHTIDKKYLPHLVGQKGSVEGAEIFNNYDLNTASGEYSHAEGSNTLAEGRCSHAEGNSTFAIGKNSHAEGSGSFAEGVNSHAEGSGTTASGYASHVEGYNSVATSEYQHVQGKFNIEDANNTYAHIVGNGTDINARSNAHTLDWSGNAWFAGDVKVGGTGQDDANAKTLATTDDLSWNSLKDRPFYYSENMTVYEATVTTSDMGGFFAYMDQSEEAKATLPLMHDQTYTIIFDDAVYSCACADGQSVGNLSLIGEGEDTGEPFVFIVTPGYMVAVATTDASATTHSITVDGPALKALDKKYIPQLPYITEQQGNQNWVKIRDFAQTNSSLMYKGITYTSGYQYFMWFLTAEGIWEINLYHYSSAQVPNANSFRMNYASSDGTLSMYWTDENDTTEITTTMYAYLRDVNNGNIIRRESDVQSVTIGAYTKKSHNIPFYIDKRNPQWEEIVRSFDDYIESYSKDEVDALMTLIKPKSTTVTIPAANWTDNANPWSQVVTVNGATENSKLDLCPTAQQIVALQNAGVSLMLQNDSGVVTAWAIGNKPTTDYTINVLLTEVSVV